MQSELGTKMADADGNDVKFAVLKPQFIPKEESKCEKPKQVKKDEEEGESPEKKAKLENDVNNENSKKQETGKSGRHRYKGKQAFHQNLCNTLIDVPENASMPVCESLRCKYLHDVKKYFLLKPPDIGEECPVFRLKGHCSRGVSCRFASKHITENGRNIVDEKVKANYESNEPKILNFFSRELENDLKRRTYNFKKSEEILDAIPKIKPLPPVPPFGPHNSNYWGTGEIDFTEDIDVPTQPFPMDIPPLMEESVGPCPEDDLFKLHLREKRKIDWRNQLYLAPLSTHGNLPFRRLCKDFGADVTCSEMVVANSILQAQVFEWLLVKRHESENLFGIQVFGNNPFVMTKCAQLLEEKTNVDFIDINVGAPGDSQILRSKGIGQLRRENATETIVRCVARVTRLPITVSSRVGDYSDEKIANKFLPNYKACDVSLVTVQGRNLETNQADWKYVDDLAQKLSPVRVYGISDVFSFRDYVQIRDKYPHVSGAIIGRGALVKPWIFNEIKEQRIWDITASERLEILKKFVNYGLEHWGSDTKGVEVTRRFLLDWLSFLCRYIPVGLLERPQQLTDKLPKFVGRNELETLFGSQELSDWVKISEMLLGPTPPHSNYVPRVKIGYWPIDS